ncbi:LisH domain-containing protein armc9 [Cladochytrium tenue]|nr:LisH domain-containing protein armc9 [Cladochytrium tenue]
MLFLEAASEAKANELVYEYLVFAEYKNAASSFKAECIDRDRWTNSSRPGSSGENSNALSSKQEKLKNELMHTFRCGERHDFFRLWDERFPAALRQSDTMYQSMEFQISVYFAVYAIHPFVKRPVTTHVLLSDSISTFKHYLETRGAALCRTAQFLPFFALPYVPDPRSHPSFMELFTERNIQELEERLDSFLSSALRVTKPPTLLNAIAYAGAQAEAKDQDGKKNVDKQRSKPPSIESLSRPKPLATRLNLAELKYEQLWLDVLSAEAVREQTARLLNAVALDNLGREYILTNAQIVALLVRVVSGEPRDTPTQQNAMGALQKLSLRRSAQSEMIQADLVEFLLDFLEGVSGLSDFSMENATALLMNLALRSAGRRRCMTRAERTLEILANLLDLGNLQVRTCVNGALFSLLSEPLFRKHAREMELKQLLLESRDETQGGQVDFILAQIDNDDEPEVDEEVESEDGEDQDDDDDEVSGGEDDSASQDDEPDNDGLRAGAGELAGDDLLARYLPRAAAAAELPPQRDPATASSSATAGRRASPSKQSTASSTRSIGSSSGGGGGHKYPDEAGLQQSRPPRPTPPLVGSPRRDQAGSGAGSRKPPPPRQSDFETGFGTRPKIPRTPF